ncbi:putative endopeptidase [Flexibacter flexilis DSM 6793]|uniref:Putative endopeptidase n=1 Tax=Flexibacter flexilis DSM 6793 TaxID=927664 RepID=A0A1I1JMY8_9BACT|nr:M13 family metallopeptidase [Flexibacter flexilis]SFC49322.1 putative endopeptidase [Flexibacter flexilis DSM 6793]
MNHSTTNYKIWVAALAFAMAACSPSEKKEETAATTKGVALANMDTTVSPRTDFYTFANGGWVKNNPVPSTESSWTSFHAIDESNKTLLRSILEEAAADKNAAAGSVTQKVGDFYKASMDTTLREKLGISPIQPQLDQIAAIKTPDDVMNWLAFAHSHGIGGLWGAYVEQDVKQSDRYITYIGQGGLGLPEKDYYLNQDSESKKYRAEYVKHIAKMFELAGTDAKTAEANAKTVLAFETELAKVSMGAVELRDIEKQYNKKTFADFKKSTPNLNWDAYFNGLGLKNLQEIVVAQPLFMEHLNKAVKTVPVADLQTYLKWHLLDGAANKLTAALEKQNFYFYETVLSGTKEMKPRWKRVISSANHQIGELVAQEYVKRAFTPESKKRVNELVDNLTAAFKVRIEKLDWMSDSTKVKAQEKLASFTRKLGYPDKWRDYSDLQIKPDAYWGNYLNTAYKEHEFQVAKWGKPIDRTEWGMTPQTVNAYYNPLLNEIVFPAAIMQPPFFDPQADDATNYGAIGAVIGHELSHGFDDQGSQFDKDGNLKNWWNKSDNEKFKAKTAILVKQFNDFKISDSLHVNGELTLGENIADLCGLTVAYEAYQLSLKGKEHKKIDGFTPEQRFFIGFAQVWANNATPEYLSQQVRTDPHSPGKFRVLGPLSNMKQFYDAFGVKEGDAMFKPEKDRAVIW